jgi:hypothetical protein
VASPRGHPRHDARRGSAPEGVGRGEIVTTIDAEEKEKGDRSFLFVNTEGKRNESRVKRAHTSDSVGRNRRLVRSIILLQQTARLGRY